ncbi:uncharacterized protein BP01DRAFT_174088 [Aspergillus saccharolyticus JOP 1030-1]|uniref:Uncharacterized protein n=1 Tax=Aspergillus saccharolyticus JOP 1030-1 TaxID=1450539 RepID=A0A318ZM25_9EURO|nr:hypothetical protein BP01DRAFT_174088 [Aspergillus saccharolyticus JOP 1030-1]PYH47977.1 hypothetical protein BP01DRAFT_174088 [Aspergillus saccharolyticus JOP 1030-1]
MQALQDPQENSPERPGTPPRPPYSPVTPTFAHLAPVIPPAANGLSHPIIPPPASPSPTTKTPPYGGLTPNFAPRPPPQSAPIFATEPAPVPISESDNPDAIALRSAISILQLQKQQSLRDIRTLDHMKRAAAADPEGFARELAAGNLTAKDKGGFIEFNHETASLGDNEDDDGAMEMDPETTKGSAFGTIPPPQNVIRMPPINWAKYQIVGESLDKMHEEQQRRPSAGEPRRDDSAQRAPEYLLASPYRPLTDKLDSPSKAKGTGSKSKKS